VEILLVSLSSTQTNHVMEHTFLRGISHCDKDTQSMWGITVCRNWIFVVCCVVLMLQV